MRPLVWFRSDLRTTDNSALHTACAAAEGPVTALFLVCGDQWREHDWGRPRVEFVRRNVAQLGADLAALDIPLLVRAVGDFDEAPAAVVAAARHAGCDAVFCNAEPEWNELQRDLACAQACADAGLAWHLHDDQTVLPPSSLATRQGGAYTVYTPFWNNWRSCLLKSGVPGPAPAPRRRPERAVAPEPGPQDWGSFAGPDVPASRWPAGERAARRRLDAFLAGPIDVYNERRNQADLADGTSELSPYLAVGAISARQCLAAVLKRDGGVLDTLGLGPAVWVKELVWREFYRHVLAGYPRVGRGRAFKVATERLAWRYDEDELAAWQQGRTGYPYVDAGMRQLAAEGWMHNRLRMITAMFLTKHLLHDWREGEQWFAQSLVDVDLASNNGGWQWCASTGTDASPYFRVFNPAIQGRRHDPEGVYVRRWVPELAAVGARDVHDPPSAVRRHCGYPDPIVDHALARHRVMAAFRGLS